MITGGAQGQGASQAQLFVEEGATVVIADIHDEAGERLSAELGEQAVFQHLDVTDEEGWARAVGRVLEEFGRIDILVNGAGINLTAWLEDTSVEDFLRLVKVNQLGPWLGIRAVAAPMRAAGGGVIVNIGSASVAAGLIGKTAYAGSKHALRGISRIAAGELGRWGIRVNAVLPGGIYTQMSVDDGSLPPDINKNFAGQPIPRIGYPEEVARAVLFLASDESSYSSGAEILVDGGMTAAPLKSPIPKHVPRDVAELVREKSAGR